MTFEEHLHKYLDDNNITSLLNSLNQDEIKGVVLNEKRMDEDTFLRLYKNVKPHPFIKNGYIFKKNEYDLGKSIYHDLGCFYIQDPSAMLVSYFLMPQEGELVLDLCAAPGGKSVGASLLMNDKGLLVSNDISSSRTMQLLTNVERMGLENVMITNLDYSKIAHKLKNTFDRIILDVPCSGSGMFRRSMEMKKDWTYQKVTQLTKIQSQLLRIAYSMLKKGGRLIYSTCSYSYEEDEEIILDFLKNSDATIINLPDSKTFYRSKELPEAIHLFPHLFEGEGHFIALLQKPGESDKAKEQKIIYKRNRKDKLGRKIVENYEISNLAPKFLLDLALRPGLFISTTTKDNEVISHQYARTNKIVNKVELNDEEYEKYVCGEQLNKQVKSGYVSLYYKNIPFAVGHAKGNVIKNMYPKGLRK